MTTQLKAEPCNEVPCPSCKVINVWPEGQDAPEYCGNCRAKWPAMTDADCRWKVSWSKDGSLGKRQESEILHDLARAHYIARQKVNEKNRSVTILKEHPQWLNRGKFFLHLIVK